MEESKHVLIPARFIALAFHLIAATMLYFCYPDNILATYPALSSASDPTYLAAKTSFMAANTLTIIALLA
jgi:hypothetical protein